MDINTMYKAMYEVYAVSKRSRIWQDKYYALGMIEMYSLATGLDRQQLINQLNRDMAKANSIR